MNSPSFEVSPGIGAFFAFFFLAVALWLLMRNMFKRLRRMNLAQREAEEHAAGQAHGSGTARQQDDRTEGGERPDRDRPDRGGSPGGDSGVGDGTEEGERGRDEV